MTSVYFFAFAIVLAVQAAVDARSRAKREAYELPDGAELLVGPVRTTFTCPDYGFGYYADVDNNCNIFHVCHASTNEDGTINSQQWSFVCGNQTVFNQLTFTCAYPEESVPCPNARDFFYLNDNVRLGDPNVPFLNDQDIQRAAPLIPGLHLRSAVSPVSPSQRRPPSRFQG